MKSRLTSVGILFLFVTALLVFNIFDLKQETTRINEGVNDPIDFAVSALEGNTPTEDEINSVMKNSLDIIITGFFNYVFGSYSLGGQIITTVGLLISGILFIIKGRTDDEDSMIKSFLKVIWNQITP